MSRRRFRVSCLNIRTLSVSGGVRSDPFRSRMIVLSNLMLCRKSVPRCVLLNRSRLLIRLILFTRSQSAVMRLVLRLLCRRLISVRLRISRLISRLLNRLVFVALVALLMNWTAVIR